MLKDLFIFTLKSLILTAIITMAIHFILTNYQIQLFETNSGIITQYIEVVKE